jgi:hypothetical protein
MVLPDWSAAPANPVQKNAMMNSVQKMLCQALHCIIILSALIPRGSQQVSSFITQEFRLVFAGILPRGSGSREFVYNIKKIGTQRS